MQIGRNSLISGVFTSTNKPLFHLNKFSLYMFVVYSLKECYIWHVFIKMESLMVTFYRCGHGDCAMIDDVIDVNGIKEPVKLYIDLGPKNFVVPSSQNMSNADLLITHSDNDHCCGKATFLTPNRIFVPAFFAEMEVILLKLLHHGNTGILNPNYKGKLIPVDKDNSLDYSPNLKWNVFNPDRKKWGDWVSNLSIPLDQIIDSINGYLSDMQLDIDVDGFIRVARDAQSYYRDRNRDVSDEDLRLFVIAVLYKVCRRSRKKKISLKRAVSAFKCHDANEYSIVFKYIDSCDNSFLFTGDAPSEVYTTNYTGKTVQARVLKVPHHGSKTGIDIDKSTPPSSVALNNINPEFMVISNANQDKTPPSVEVLRFLSSQPGKILLMTNDFTKLAALNGVKYKGVGSSYVFPNGIQAQII